MLVAVKYKIWGNLRFLSHAETMRMFQRACVRAGISLEYSKGYNPRPAVSLPLPRSVGCQADDELLLLRVSARQNSGSGNIPNTKASDIAPVGIKEALSKQLPYGIEIASVRLEEPASRKEQQPAVSSPKKVSLQPIRGTYQFLILKNKGFLKDGMEKKKENLLSMENIFVIRTKTSGKKGHGNGKKELKYEVNIRPFLREIRLSQGSEECVQIDVDCNISPSGSVRVDEILGLFGLDTEVLAAPVRRKDVQWRKV